MHTPWRRLALLSLLLSSGCTAVAGAALGPVGEAAMEKALEEPPHAVALSGEILDYATFRPEPHAAIEFWSENLSAVPEVKVDARGRFSLRVDTCRRDEAAPGRDGDGAPPPGCRAWIGRFQARARLGGRCSLPVPDDGQGGGDGLVLWLRPCEETGASARTWRPARLVGEEATPPSPPGLPVQTCPI